MMLPHCCSLLLCIIVTAVSGFSPQGYIPTRRTAHPNTLQAVSINDTNQQQLFAEHPFVLVDACAQWCGPCRLMEGVLKTVQKSKDWNLQVATYDVEDPLGKELKLELVLQNVRPQKLPSFIVFQNGQAVGQREGMMTVAEMEDFLRSCGVPNTRTAAPQGRVSLAQTQTADSYMLSSA